MPAEANLNNRAMSTPGGTAPPTELTARRSGYQLAEERKRHGLTQAQLAQAPKCELTDRDVAGGP